MRSGWLCLQQRDQGEGANEREVNFHKSRSEFGFVQVRKVPARETHCFRAGALVSRLLGVLTRLVGVGEVAAVRLVLENVRGAGGLAAPGLRVGAGLVTLPAGTAGAFLLAGLR